MPLNTFPTLPGLGWNIKKRVVSSTAIEQSSSGAEWRTSRYGATPIFEFELTANFLSQSTRDTLETFFTAQQGPSIEFNLAITDDPASPFIVRFKDDFLEFNQMMKGFYEAKSIKFRTSR